MNQEEHGPYFRRALKSTAPILEKKSLGGSLNIGPFGSGVFLKVGSEIFLITAAHLLNADTWPILAIFLDNRGEGLNLIGRLFTSMPNGGTKRMDISIFMCDKSMHEDLKEYDIISFSDIKFAFKPKQNSTLLLAGYPTARFNHVVNQKEIQISPYNYYTSPKNQSIYEKLGLSDTCYIASEYRRRVYNPNGEKITGPVLEGMSGSGLWIIDEDKKVKLIGINTEYYSNEGYIISIRIDLVISILNRLFNFDPRFRPEILCEIGTTHEIPFPDQLIE